MSKSNQLVSCRTSAIGLTLRPNTSYEEWWKDGLSLAERIKSDLWAIGDWLREGECNGFIADGKLKDACAIFDMAYSTLANTVSVCRSLESSRRRETLPFSHHAEVANRKDADELLDWCEENDATRNQLRKEKKARDEKALENGEILETDDEVEEDASFDFGGDDEPEAEPEEELEPMKDDHGRVIPPKLEEIFTDGPPTIKELMNRVSKLNKDIKDAAGEIDGCSIIPITATDIALKDCRTALKSAIPTWICVCNGRGCKKCDSRGWLQKQCGVLFDEVEA